MAKDLVQKFMDTASHQQKSVFAAKVVDLMQEESSERYTKLANAARLMQEEESFLQVTKACTHYLEDITLDLETLADSLSDVDDKNLPDEHAAMMERMLCVISLQSYIFFLQTGNERFLTKMVDQTPLGYHQLLDLIRTL